jgi:hypothetical protein
MGKLSLEFQRAWNNLVDWCHYHLSGGDYKKMRDAKTYPEFRKAANTDEKIGAAMNHTKYKAEPAGEDNWKDPYTTFDDESGDCDDFSGEAADIDNYHHPPSKPGLGRLLVACWGEGKDAHATTYKPGKNISICNWGRIYHESSDVKDIVQFWYKPWVGIMTFYQKITNPDSAHPGYEYVMVDYLEPTADEVKQMKQTAASEAKEVEEQFKGSYLKIIGGFFAKLFTRKPKLTPLGYLIGKFTKAKQIRIPKEIGTFEEVVKRSRENYNKILTKIGEKPLEELV